MVKNILFILVGIVSIGLSISCFNADTGQYVSENYYGGDAYTGIQHAAAETGQNVRDLAKLAAKGFGSILLVSFGTHCRRYSIKEKRRETNRNSKGAGNSTC